MSNIGRIKRAIQSAVADGYVTKTELARAARLPITTLIGMEKAEWNPLSVTLEALDQALEALSRQDGKRRPSMRAQPAA